MLLRVRQPVRISPQGGPMVPGGKVALSPSVSVRGTDEAGLGCWALRWFSPQEGGRPVPTPAIGWLHGRAGHAASERWCGSESANWARKEGPGKGGEAAPGHPSASAPH